MALILSAPLMHLGGCTASRVMDGNDIPAPLLVPAGEVLTLRAHAVGAQIYRCSADKNDASRFEWLLKAPEADLFDQSGERLGKHYAGPTWEARDGSKVVGEVAARADSSDANAVAWLLLTVKAASGSGVFTSIRFVQRLRTAGGTAPREECNPGAAGTEVRAPYSAEYWFYSDKKP